MISIKEVLNPEYWTLSPKDLEDKAYELAFTYAKYSKSCAQGVLAGLNLIVEIDNSLVKVGTSFTGGHSSQSAGTCGGLIGGTLVLDYFFGRPIEQVSSSSYSIDSLQMLADAQQITYQLYRKYLNEYGTILCPEIQAQLLGRQYCLWDPHEKTEFENLGGFRTICSHVLGNTARWVMQILIARGTNQQYLIREI